MANIRTLPDKYYDKDYETNGIHRVPLWRIAGFVLNNTATNTYLFLMNYVSYYLMGFVGVGMVVASSFTTCMRLWDGVTDPLAGSLLDRTNGKFGKNRPFMVIGDIILAITSFILFHVTHLLPEKTMIRFPFFIVICCIYYLGYTFQCICTKSAQSVLTSDPKQRPLFASFDGMYNAVLFAVLGIIAPRIATRYEEFGGYSSTQWFHAVWVIVVIMAAIFTTIAVISIAPKDRQEFYGTGNKAAKTTFKDYWDVIKNNRAMQMLVLSASTDKLGSQAKTSAVQVAFFACIAGSTLLQSNVTAILTIPQALAVFILISYLGPKLGQRQALVVGSIGALIFNGALICLSLFGDPSTMTSNPETGELHWGYFLILYIVLTILAQGFQGVSGSIVVPMTADVSDYEVYRSGKYVPGLIGTIFSFVDKLVSSLAPMIAGWMFAIVGYSDHNPVMGDEVTWGLRVGVAFCMYGVIMIGLVLNLVAMHFYPLTKEKMAEIEGEIAAIKAKATSEN